MKHCPLCGRSYPESQRFCLDDGALLSLRDPYHLLGRTLAAKYRLDALVGLGGMGAVYSAHHLALDRRVAFKILQPNLTLGNARTLDLFEREARLAGRLAHENIVMVLDAGRTAEDIAYIAMEWLEGRTLEEELAARGPLDFRQAAEILRQVAAALDAAHAERIIHRDLKPANIMLIQRPDGGDRVKVLDFGIGKALSETAGSPVSSVMGTPHYASPEQFQLHGPIDARTDIYSLGVTLFQMLTGALPFAATSARELIRLHMTAAPPPLRRFRPEAPAVIEQLLDRMLAKDPDGRPAQARQIPSLFESALEMAGQAKEAAQHGQQIIDRRAGPNSTTIVGDDNIRQASEPSGAPPQSSQSQTNLLNNRKRILLAVAGIALLLVASLSFAPRLFSSDDSPGSDGERTVGAPTRQTQPEPEQGLKQTPALIANQSSGDPKGEKGAKSDPMRPSLTGGPEARLISGRWLINANDTVLDTQTALMWMKKDFRVLEGRFVQGWQEAMNWAKKMNSQRYAGHSDWQVPSISEYRSIRDRVAYPQIFESQGEDCYWARNEPSKWVASYIYIRDGAAVSGDKNNGTGKPNTGFNGKFSVRLVRQAE